MPPRYQVGDIKRPNVTPVATPVDSFERTAAGAQVAQLAEALAGLAPELRQFTDVEVAGQKQAGVKHAEQIIAEGRQIRAGEIGAGEGRYFRMAAKEQYGRLVAGKFGSKLTQRMADPEDILGSSTSLEDFETAVAQERSQFLTEIGGGDDPAFTAGFNAAATREVQAQRDRFAAQSSQRLQTQVIENTYQEHQLSIESTWTGIEDAPAIAKAIYERNTIAYAAGSDGAMLSRTMLRAVIDTAKKMGDLDVLEILKHIPGGPKNSMLANTSLANKLVPEAIEQIRGMRIQKRNLENGEAKDEQRDSYEEALGNMYDALDAAEAAGKPMSTVDVNTFVGRVMPSEAEKVHRAYEAYKNRAEADDEVIAKGLWQSAFRSELTYDDVAIAFENGDLTVETSRKLRSEIKRNRARRGATKAMTQDVRFTNARSRLKGLFVNEYGANDPDAEVRAEFAIQDMENAWVTWRAEEGKNASEEDVKSWLHNAIRLYAGTRGTEALREALDSMPSPQSGSVGPQIVKWEKGLVIKNTSWLGQLADAIRRYETEPKYQLPPAVEEVLRQHGVKHIADARRFLQVQRSFIPFGSADRP